MTKTTMIVATLAALMLSACGTASGLAEGTGRVFEGVGEDFRSLRDLCGLTGDWLFGLSPDVVVVT